MMFLTVLLLLVTKGYSTPIGGYQRRAIAVVYEEDGIWGSITFQQASKDGPVLIEAEFKDLPPGTFEYEIRERGVDYNGYSKEEQCSERALHGVLTDGKEVGRLHKGVTIGGSAKQTFSNSDISLYAGRNNIIGRSFVLRVGDMPVCGSVVDGAGGVGLVPCVKKTYERCLIGAGRFCRYRTCEGYERFWGALREGVSFCHVRKEVFPKASLREGEAPVGRVACSYGLHGLLIPSNA